MNVFLTKRNTIFPKVLIGIIVFLIFIGILNLFQKQFKNFFYFVSEPLQKTFWKVGNNTSSFLRLFLKTNDLDKINKELSIRNQELLEEINILYNEKIENQALRKAIGMAQEKKFKLILTNIMGIDSYQDSILVDQGSEDGISENMPVINSQKVLFGKVSKVYKNFSKIMLVSNPKIILDVKVQKDDTIFTPVYGAVRGKGNLKATLDTVTLDSEIKNGDILITSSLEGTFPRDLLVGKIIEVRKDDLKPFQTAKIELFFSLKQIDKLFIISDYKIEK